MDPRGAYHVQRETVVALAIGRWPSSGYLSEKDILEGTSATLFLNEVKVQNWAEACPGLPMNVGQEGMAYVSAPDQTPMHFTRPQGLDTGFLATI